MFFRCAVPFLFIAWLGVADGHGLTGVEKTWHQAAFSNRPSSTAVLTSASRCAPLGDHHMRCRFASRAFAISSTRPSARDDEIGALVR
jgi:hypothetical protein